MDSSHLILIDTCLFYEGMRINSSIYYYQNGNYILFCKNIVLTQQLMRRLQNVAKVTNGIFIEEKDYEDFLSDSLQKYPADIPVYDHKLKKAVQQYQKVVSETTTLLKKAKIQHYVSLEMAENISDAISDSLNQSEHASILHCINMIQQADDYLYNHSVNVATLNGLLGKWTGASERQVKQLIKTGLVHDLGKLKVPGDILNKPGKLTDSEFEVIKLHPSNSRKILIESGERDEEILRAVLQHHERQNGTGYPRGLCDTDICPSARITAICDVYDAMVSKRCYKDANTPFEVMAQLSEHRFSNLDWQIIKVFLDNIIYLFVGTHVRLSNNQEGEIVYVRPDNFEYPIVKSENRVFATSPECKCVN